MSRTIWLFSFILLTHAVSCKQPEIVIQKEKVIRIQPFIDIPENEISYIDSALRELYSNVILSRKIAFPEHAINKLEYRYRADSLIRYLNTLAGEDEVIIGLTNRDISTTKGNVEDWGVMGLGYCPGRSCIASSFRLRNHHRMEGFSKVTIHELGHTEGLPHCKILTCFMRDAEGENTTDEETDFCSKCKKFLIEKKWKFR